MAGEIRCLDGTIGTVKRGMELVRRAIPSTLPGRNILADGMSTASSATWNQLNGSIKRGFKSFGTTIAREVRSLANNVTAKRLLIAAGSVYSPFALADETGGMQPWHVGALVVGGGTAVGVAVYHHISTPRNNLLKSLTEIPERPLGEDAESNCKGRALQEKYYSALFELCGYTFPFQLKPSEVKAITDGFLKNNSLVGLVALLRCFDILPFPAETKKLFAETMLIKHINMDPMLLFPEYLGKLKSILFGESAHEVDISDIVSKANEIAKNKASQNLTTQASKEGFDIYPDLKLSRNRNPEFYLRRHTFMTYYEEDRIKQLPVDMTSDISSKQFIIVEATFVSVAWPRLPGNPNEEVPFVTLRTFDGIQLTVPLTPQSIRGDGVMSPPVWMKETA